MSLNLGPIADGESRLRTEFVEFSRLWLDVKEVWRDDRCRRFEQEHLATIGPSLNRLATAISEFSEQIRKAERALEDADRTDFAG